MRPLTPTLALPGSGCPQLRPALLRQGQRWKVSHLHSNRQRLTAHGDRGPRADREEDHGRPCRRSLGWHVWWLPPSLTMEGASRMTSEGTHDGGDPGLGSLPDARGRWPVMTASGRGGG